jgi:3-deoxy-D-manno-octulosonic-acid transferase
MGPLLINPGTKLTRGIRGRHGVIGRLRRWAEEERRPELPLVWFHAPSVGEGLQARVVMEVLRRGAAPPQIAYTHFSPSAQGLAERMPAEVADYLPWDTLGQVRAALDSLQPDLLVFTKTEVWPVLAREARHRGIPVVLIAATLPPDAGRLRFPARLLLRSVFGGLDRVLAISSEDGRRFTRLGVDPSRIEITGDPGIDSARTRALKIDPDAPHLVPFHRDPRPTVVAGSTWSADEAVLLPALGRLRATLPQLRLVIAPHEPTAAHLARLEEALDEGGWARARLGEIEEKGSVEGVAAVVVDRVGVLAPLYSVGSVAYVGGGFHRHGLHSVLEPAAVGCPVAFGPRHANARAAGDLIREGGAHEVADAHELSDTVAQWLTPPERGRAAGRRAEGYIRRHAGAATETARELMRLLPGPDSATGSDIHISTESEEDDR